MDQMQGARGSAARLFPLPHGQGSLRPALGGSQIFDLRNCLISQAPLPRHKELYDNESYNNLKLV